MIKTALIGCGYWGSKLLRYLRADKHFKVVHVCNSKTDLSKVWPDVEVVVVATPMDTHYQVVKQALLQGKHVLSEKPLALKTKECLELKRLAEEKGLVLAVEYTWTFSQGLQKAQKINIGIIKAIEMDIKHLGRFLKWDVYWLLASHMLSILDMFVPLKTLKFEKIDLLQDRGLAETGMILFENKKVKGRINISINYIEKQTKVVIYGTKGTIIYEPLAERSLRVGWYKKTEGLGKELLIKTKSYSYDETNNLKHAVEYFYQVIRGKAKTNINRAIEITRIIESKY